MSLLCVCVYVCVVVACPCLPLLCTKCPFHLNKWKIKSVLLGFLIKVKVPLQGRNFVCNFSPHPTNWEFHRNSETIPLSSNPLV